MRLFFHTFVTTSFMWMTLHYWRQLPLREGETAEGRIREFLEWGGKGVVAPILIWFLMNLGLTTGLPPILPEVDAAKNAGGFWLWRMLQVWSPAMTVIATYWSALSLMGMLWMIWTHTEDRAGFKGTALIWSLVMLPVSLAIVLISGWAGGGSAMAVWLAVVIQQTLPDMEVRKAPPSYAQAIGRIKFGKYTEAEWDVIRELEKHENDFNGWMLLAELYAVHFNDFRQAEQTVIDLCEQPDIIPSDACVALHRLCDWYLQLRKDPQGARRCMEAIVTRYPNTHLARMAQLRLKRIPPTAEEWIEEMRNKPLHLPALHDDLEESEALAPEETDAVRQRAELMSRKLVREPNDVQAREEFARALATLNQLDAAIEQVRLLLAMEAQLPARRAEWMGLEAAWTQKLNPDAPELRGLFHRIIQDCPGTPQAMAARRRILLMDERKRVAKYGRTKPQPRIVIRPDPPTRDPTDGSTPLV